MKQIKRVLIIMGAIIVVLSLSKKDIFASQNNTEMVEVDWNFAELEGSSEPYEYSLDSDDNFSENHIWSLEAGSEHILYIKRPNTSYVQSVEMVVPQKEDKTETYSEWSEVAEGFTYPNGKIAGEDEINQYLGITEASTEHETSTEKDDEKTSINETKETSVASEEITESATEGQSVSAEVNKDGVNWIIVIVVLIVAVIIVAGVFVVTSKKK